MISFWFIKKIRVDLDDPVKTWWHRPNQLPDGFKNTEEKRESIPIGLYNKFKKKRKIDW